MTENSAVQQGGLFFQLVKRHLLVFFRNKLRMFFTLMVPFIIFVIYILFLRDLELNSVSSVLADLAEKHNAPEIKALSANAEFIKKVETLIDSWMLSGIIAISTMTVSLQTNTMIVADRETGVNKDFVSSPINRNLLIGSYFLFNFIVTLSVCFMFLLACFIYLACMGEFCITFVDFLSMVGILAFSSCVSVLLTIFICSFVSRDATMASITTIFSTAIGFLIGAYMPMSMLPEFARNFCVFVPGTFSCSLLRFSFMATPLADLTSFTNDVLQIAGGSEIINELSANFGYNMEFFGISLEPWSQAVGQLIFIAVLIIANILAGKNVVKTVAGMGKKLKTKKGKK